MELERGGAVELAFRLTLHFSKVNVKTVTLSSYFFLSDRC